MIEATIFNTTTGAISQTITAPADIVALNVGAGHSYIEGIYSPSEFTINTSTLAPEAITVTPPTLAEHKAAASTEIANASAGKISSRTTEFMIVQASGDTGAISDFHDWINSVLAASNAAISAINVASSNSGVDSATATGIAAILAL